MKKWLFPNRSRINMGWSLDHQGMKKHQFGSIGSFRNHEKHQKISKNDKLKNWPRKWTDKHVRSWSRSLLGSFGLFSSFFWSNMTLRADRLKSNYLGCWIFEISSAPDLENFSILFFVFLNIRSVEFDKFHLVFAFWVAWGLGTLRLTRLWIYIWVFVEVGSLMWVKILKIFMKKWLFPNRSRINLGWFLDLKSIKKHPFEWIGSFQKHQKHEKREKHDKLKNW